MLARCTDELSDGPLADRARLIVFETQNVAQHDHRLGPDEQREDHLERVDRIGCRLVCEGGGCAGEVAGTREGRARMAAASKERCSGPTSKEL